MIILPRTYATVPLLLPISISVHHGLVDGRNVAEFIQNVKDGQNNTL